MMSSCESIESLSTVVSDDAPPKAENNFNGMFDIGEADCSLFEIGEPDDVGSILQEPTREERAGPSPPAEVEIIEEEPSKESHKRRLSFSDQLFGQVQKLLKTTTADGGVEFVSYESGVVTEYQPTVQRAK